MPENDVVRTILIVSDDIGFLMWLGRALTDVGFRAFPATNSAEAALRAAESEFDVVIADFNLEGIRHLVEELCRRNPRLGVMAIGEPSGIAEGIAEVAVPKPSDSNESAIRELWQTEVSRLLERKHSAGSV